MTSHIMYDATIQFELEPRYDEEYLTIREQISIKLEMILIDKLLVGFRVAEETIVDFYVELKFITDWLEKPKNAENVDYVCDEKCIRFADAEEILLQNSTAQNIAGCNRAWMTIIKFAEVVKDKGRSRTAEAQPNSKIHIQMKYTSMCEDFKFSSRKNRKRKKYKQILSDSD